MNNNQVPLISTQEYSQNPVRLKSLKEAISKHFNNLDIYRKNSISREEFYLHFAEVVLN